jgi:hypothetical protein
MYTVHLWFSSRYHSEHCDEVLMILADLQRKKTLPVFYNDVDGELVPLGQLATHNVRNLNEPELENRVILLHDLLKDPNKVCDLTLILETDKGIFCRTVESVENAEVTLYNDRYVASIKWSPITVGQDSTLLSSYITYGERIIIYVKSVTEYKTGDLVNVTYTLDSWGKS